MSKKTTMYHSGLVKNSPMRIRVTSDAIKSKYPTKPDGSGSYFVTFEYDGGEYAYTSENDAVAQFLGRYKNQDVTITASGAREDARISVDGATGAHQEASGAPQKRPSTSGGSGDPVQDYRHGLMRVVNALYANYKAMAKLAEQLEVDGVKLTADQIQAGASTAFITLDRQGLVQNLPDKPLWSAEKQLEEMPEPKGEEPW